MSFYRKKVKPPSVAIDPQKQTQQNNAYESVKLTANLQENIQYVKQIFGTSSDIITREINIGVNGQIKIALLYTDGLTFGPGIQHLLDSLMLDYNHLILSDDLSNDSKKSSSKEPPDNQSQTTFQLIKNRILPTGEINEVSDYDDLFTSMLSGDVIFLMDGVAQGLKIGLRSWQSRGVEKPEKEVVVRGPHQSFNENLRVNTALIRRIVKSPHLWIESRIIGRLTQTSIAIVYIKNLVNDDLVEEVRKRLGKIDIDGILDSSYIEELIQDETYTPFPNVYNTERPDIVAGELLQGKIAIIVDGSPYVLIVPAVFVTFFHSPEDYYQRADIATFIRLIRYLAIAISFTGTSIYVATITFHHEMLPTLLLISLAAQREGVPFPAFVEALIMELMFEILREAGLRMPKSVGQAISIVGSLVLGTAAVEAGFVSAAMVIVVAATAVSSFVFPANNMSIAFRMLRFPLLILAASFGLFGVIVGVIALTLHLCSLRSFGIPYMTPFAPFIASDQKDAIFRAPQWAMRTRPSLLNNKNRKRQQHDADDPPNKRKSGR